MLRHWNFTFPCPLTLNYTVQLLMAVVMKRTRKEQSWTKKEKPKTRGRIYEQIHVSFGSPAGLTHLDIICWFSSLLFFFPWLFLCFICFLCFLAPLYCFYPSPSALSHQAPCFSLFPVPYPFPLHPLHHPEHVSSPLSSLHSFSPRTGLRRLTEQSILIRFI